MKSIIPMSEKGSTKKMIFATCECGRKHEPGCPLLLWLLLKYGDEVNGIMSIPESMDGKKIRICLSEEILSELDRQFDRLIEDWVQNKRHELRKEDVTWC